MGLNQMALGILQHLGSDLWVTFAMDRRYRLKYSNKTANIDVKNSLKERNIHSSKTANIILPGLPDRI